MTVELNSERFSKILKYDDSVVLGETADLRCQNPNDMSDVSERKGFVNDGNVYVSFPRGYSGEVIATVTGSDGGEDTGTVEISEAA